MATPPSATANLQDGHLGHDLNVGGVHHLLCTDRPLHSAGIKSGCHSLGLRMDQGPLVAVPLPLPLGGTVLAPAYRRATLLIDGQPVGTLDCRHGVNMLISWSGRDIGLDRGAPGSHDSAPYAFSGRLHRVVVTLDPLPALDGDAPGQPEMVRQ